MVRKILNFFLYLLFFIGALMYVTPKISLYYFAEQQIKPLGIIISKEILTDSGFSLEIKNANISAKGIESAVIQNMNLKLLGFYNNFSAHNIQLASVADSFLPLNIKFINIKHSIFNPLFITGEAKGAFGEAILKIDILKRVIQLKLLPSKEMKNRYKRTLQNLKKNKNGEYIYEKNL